MDCLLKENESFFHLYSFIAYVGLLLLHT